MKNNRTMYRLESRQLPLAPGEIIPRVATLTRHTDNGVVSYHMEGSRTGSHVIYGQNYTRAMAHWAGYLQSAR
jgi:hypothetical protein